MAEADFIPIAASTLSSVYCHSATLHWRGDNIGFSDGAPIFVSLVDGDGQSICLTLGAALARADCIDCHDLTRILLAAKAAAGAGEMGAADARAWDAWELSCEGLAMVRCGFHLDGGGRLIMELRDPAGASHVMPVPEIAERMRRPRWHIEDSNGTYYRSFLSREKAARFANAIADDGDGTSPAVFVSITREVYQ